MYKLPIYTAENNNGDVVVSDLDLFAGADVVTDCRGKHRFSYTGNSPGSGLLPCGICTDALSHILVCDNKTETIHIHVLDVDGHYLSYISTKSLETVRPHNLSYDHNTHRLWVKSEKNKLWVFQYISDQTVLTG